MLVFLKPFLRHVALHLDAVCGLHRVRLGLRLVDEVLEKGNVLAGLPVLRGYGGIIVDIASSASDPLADLFPKSLAHPCAIGLCGVGESRVDAIPLFRGELGKILGEVLDIGAVGLRQVGCVLRACELHQRVHGAFALRSDIVHELLGAGVELDGGIQHGGLPPFRHGGELVGVALLPIGKGEPRIDLVEWLALACAFEDALGEDTRKLAEGFLAGVAGLDGVFKKIEGFLFRETRLAKHLVCDLVAFGRVDEHLVLRGVAGLVGDEFAVGVLVAGLLVKRIESFGGSVVVEVGEDLGNMIPLLSGLHGLLVVCPRFQSDRLALQVVAGRCVDLVVVVGRCLVVDELGHD